MKSIIFLSFVFLLASSCNPLNMDDNKERKPKIDLGEGKKEFSLPDLKDISELEKAAGESKKNCSDYETPFVSILGKYSITGPIARCIAKALDEGLKPLCDQEEAAEKALQHYKKEGNEQGIAETEQYLNDLEDLKYDTAEEIYTMADVVDEQCEELLDDQEKGIDDAEKNWAKFVRRIGKLATSSECGGLRGSIDHKARTVCRNFDISKIGRR